MGNGVEELRRKAKEIGIHPIYLETFRTREAVICFQVYMVPHVINQQVIRGSDISSSKKLSAKPMVRLLFCTTNEEPLAYAWVSFERIASLKKTLEKDRRLKVKSVKSGKEGYLRFEEEETVLLIKNLMEMFVGNYYHFVQAALTKLKKLLKEDAAQSEGVKQITRQEASYAVARKEETENISSGRDFKAVKEDKVVQPSVQQLKAPAELKTLKKLTTKVFGKQRVQNLQNKTSDATTVEEHPAEGQGAKRNSGEMNFRQLQDLYERLWVVSPKLGRLYDEKGRGEYIKETVELQKEFSKSGRGIGELWDRIIALGKKGLEERDLEPLYTAVDLTESLIEEAGDRLSKTDKRALWRDEGKLHIIRICGEEGNLLECFEKLLNILYAIIDYAENGRWVTPPERDYTKYLDKLAKIEEELAKTRNGSAQDVPDLSNASKEEKEEFLKHLGLQKGKDAFKDGEDSA